MAVTTRHRPPRPFADVDPAVHHQRTAAVLGLALAATFSICFLTGVTSHLIQHPPSWFAWPPRPAGLYRVTQGLHVASGIASIPLLLAKVYAVYPHAAGWPPVRSVAHAVERISLVPLMGGSVFLLVSGVFNIERWYPYGFDFLIAHYAAAWIAMAGLVMHVVAKISITREALRRSPDAGATPAAGPSGVGRRGFVTAAVGASGVLTLVTLGQTVRPLQRLGLLAPRAPDRGPQGLPVNKSAQGAGITADAIGPDYRLTVVGPGGERSFTIEALRAMTQHEATLPIACVEGWSADARWRGVRIRDLMAIVGGQEAPVLLRSLQQGGGYGSSEMTPAQAGDRDALLALEINGEPLHVDHGAPARLIGPNRPGVHQTKWVHRIEVIA